jgi:hypothetical protein
MPFYLDDSTKHSLGGSLANSQPRNLVTLRSIALVAQSHRFSSIDSASWKLFHLGSKAYVPRRALSRR